MLISLGKVWLNPRSVTVALPTFQPVRPVTVNELGGAGAWLPTLENCLIVLQHPVTNEAEEAAAQLGLTLDMLPKVPTLVFWPGQDAGAEAMSKLLRRYQDRVHTVRNLPPERFLRLLTQCRALIGNSSAGIRECSYLGVPVVNIGSRQDGRERGREPSLWRCLVQARRPGA